MSLTGQEMITHVQHELDTIQRRQTNLKREQQVKYSLSTREKQRNHYFFIRFFKIIIIITSIKHSKLVTKYDELHFVFLNFEFLRTSRQQRLNGTFVFFFYLFDFHHQQLFSS